MSGLQTGPFTFCTFDLHNCLWMEIYAFTFMHYLDSSSFTLGYTNVHKLAHLQVKKKDICSVNTATKALSASNTSFFIQTISSELIETLYTGQKKAIIHQVNTMLATSKNVLFPGHNHLLTTGADDLTLIIKVKGHHWWL